MIIDPNQIGNPNKILNAIAVPITSCMSLPIIAISAIIQSVNDNGLGNCCLQRTARSLPVTTPTLALKIWIMSPQKVAAKRVHRSPYPPWVPARRSPSTKLFYIIKNII